tara:strand:+ start:6441 stop:7865 length:1425 start_codon:yes stop_codon:yes gene_type:complete
MAPQAFSSPAGQPDVSVAIDGVEEQVQTSMSTVITTLVELADRCQKDRNFLQRNVTYELLITLEPDHKEARKTLGYKWDRKEETWTPPKRPKTPKDKDPALALEVMEARDVVLTGHRDRVLAALAKAPDLPKDRRLAIVKSVIQLLPDDATLRAAAGQVKHKDKWIDESTARSLTIREQREARIKELKKEIGEPESTTSTPAEDALGQTWSGKLKTANLRILGTCSKTELTKIATYSQATVSYLNEIFKTEPIKNANLYVLLGDGSKNSFMDKWPGLEPDKRTLYKQLFAVYLDFDNLASIAPTDDKRLDAAVRLNVYRHLNHNWNVYEKHGWVNEGFGMYLTWQITGTRLVFFVRDTEYTDPNQLELNDLNKKLREGNVDWLKLAKKQLTGKKRVNLSFMLGRDVNQLTPEDLLISYALAAYILETQEPAVVTRIMKLIGEGQPSAAVLEEELKVKLPKLPETLATWLDEIGK